MEGKILERVTKATRSKRSKYKYNYFNVGELKPIVIFGEKGATGHLTSNGLVKIVPNMPPSETDTTSIGVVREEDSYMFTQAHNANQEDALSIITNSSMGSYQTSVTLRRARVSNPEEIMANELYKTIRK